MNDFHKKLFADLMALVNDTDEFYKQEFVLDGHIYWIFNYRLASYTDFCKPSALECRGHMFEVDASGNMIRLAALPMQKFFNLNENPFTMNLDLVKVDEIQDKRDGSLITTFVHEGAVRLKSRGSIFSDQVLAAEKWLFDPKNSELYGVLRNLAALDISVNLEWTAPDNRIVIGYKHPELMILNARYMHDGSYVDFNTMGHHVKKYVVKSVIVEDTKAFIESIPAMLDDIEGYVIKKGDLWFKVKTDKYCSLHHTKDSITNPRRLFECVLDEGSDDLLAMFSTDELAVAQIRAMQEFVKKTYNGIVAQVDSFYQANKTLDRKDYAIKGQAELPQHLFSLAMNLYLQKDPNYKEWMKAKYKLFGIADAVKEAE
jgi:T4 RnlA family RNA ligase